MEGAWSRALGSAVLFFRKDLQNWPAYEGTIELYQKATERAFRLLVFIAVELGYIGILIFTEIKQ